MGVKKRGKYWHYEVMIDGQRYWGSTKETVKSRALTFEALQIAEIRSNGANPNLRGAPLLVEFAKRFLTFVDNETEARHLDRDTQRYYHLGWKRLKGTPLANMRIDRICTTDASVIRFGGSPSYANMAFRTLSRMLHLAVDWKVLRAAPKIKTLEEHGRAALVESSTELELLKNAPQPLSDILTVIMDCGMRPEEAMRMRWEHVFWERNVILVPYGKSFRSRRFVPLSERIVALLRRRACAGEWVFPSPRAESGHLTTVAKQWRATAKAAGVPSNLKLYCARHTFATDMYRAGMSLLELQELLGHEDIKTTMKYLHIVPAGTAAEKVNQRNAGKKPFLVKESA